MQGRVAQRVVATSQVRPFERPTDHHRCCVRTRTPTVFDLRARTSSSRPWFTGLREPRRAGLRGPQPDTSQLDPRTRWRLGRSPNELRIHRSRKNLHIRRDPAQALRELLERGGPTFQPQPSFERVRRRCCRESRRRRAVRPIRAAAASEFAAVGRRTQHRMRHRWATYPANPLATECGLDETWRSDTSGSAPASAARFARKLSKATRCANVFAVRR